METATFAGSLHVFMQENDNTTSLQAHLMEFVVNASAMIHEFPRSCIRVVIQEIQNDGSVLACAVNATCLALMDAGVPLTSLFTAASCAIVDDNIMIDPSMREVKVSTGINFPSIYPPFLKLFRVMICRCRFFLLCTFSYSFSQIHTHTHTHSC